MEFWIKMLFQSDQQSNIPLSFGQARELLVQRMYLTWPRPCLARPLFLLFCVIPANTKYDLLTGLLTRKYDKTSRGLTSVYGL